MNTSNHGHSHLHAEFDKGVKGRLKISIALTAIIFVAELVGGYLTGSLALMSDAAHVFMDVFALSLTLFALYIANMPPTETRTFGLHRVEVFVSWINSFILIIITAVIFYESYKRFVAPAPVESLGMMIVAIVGLIVNLVVAFWLAGYARHDLNVKSAYVHVIGDAAASIGVIIGAVIIRFTGWTVVDSVISIAIGIMILYGSWGVMAEASHILLEGVPKEIDLNKVVDDLKSNKGVVGVHSLHIWSICHNVFALSAHLDIEPTERRRTSEIYANINETLAARHHIYYTTLQAECSGCENTGVLRKFTHRERQHTH